MEQSATLKTLHHGELMQKAAYISRTDYHCDYDDRNCCWSKHDRSDLIYSNTILAKGMPFKYTNPETLINNFETDYVCRYKTTSLARDHVFSVSNDFVKFDDKGRVDKKATSDLIKKDLDQFFKSEFGDEGYAVIYAVHYGQKGKKHIADNLHVHALVLCNKYDEKKQCWLSKSYKNHEGKFVYRNPLDDRKTSGQTLKKIRKDFATWQNKRLVELSKAPNIQSKSFKERKIGYLSSYHLKKYHYEELLKLKREYSYISNVFDRNEKIISDRKGKLTKRQVHNLRAEGYNWLLKQKKDLLELSPEKIKDEALIQADINKKADLKKLTSSAVRIGQTSILSGGIIKSAVRYTKKIQEESEEKERSR